MSLKSACKWLLGLMLIFADFREVSSKRTKTHVIIARGCWDKTADFHGEMLGKNTTRFIEPAFTLAASAHASTDYSCRIMAMTHRTQIVNNCIVFHAAWSNALLEPGFSYCRQHQKFPHNRYKDNIYVDVPSTTVRGNCSFVLWMDTTIPSSQLHTAPHFDVVPVPLTPL